MAQSGKLVDKTSVDQEADDRQEQPCPRLATQRPLATSSTRDRTIPPRERTEAITVTQTAMWVSASSPRSSRAVLPRDIESLLPRRNPRSRGARRSPVPSVTRPSGEWPDPWLCVPASRRVCLYREEVVGEARVEAMGMPPSARFDYSVREEPVAAAVIRPSREASWDSTDRRPAGGKAQASTRSSHGERTRLSDRHSRRSLRRSLSISALRAASIVRYAASTAVTRVAASGTPPIRPRRSISAHCSDSSRPPSIALVPLIMCAAWRIPPASAPPPPPPPPPGDRGRRPPEGQHAVRRGGRP